MGLPDILLHTSLTTLPVKLVMSLKGKVSQILAYKQAPMAGTYIKTVVQISMHHCWFANST